jgi:hypothetical protein
MKRPAALWFLVFWLFFLALGGLYGGIAMLLDPSGGLLQMTGVLPLLPVKDYILPGLFLFGIMGLLPLSLLFGLWVRPKNIWGKYFISPMGYHWAWTGTICLGIVLAFWLFIQGILIGFQWPIQYVTAINGILIMLFALLPSVREYYRKHHDG